MTEMAALLKDTALARLGVGVAHHFGGGVYVKETLIPAGAALGQHAHEHDHLSYLVMGTVNLWADGVRQQYAAPACIAIEAGKVHGVCAVTDAVWLCIWSSDCTDPDQVDAAVTR